MAKVVEPEGGGGGSSTVKQQASFTIVPGLADGKGYSFRQRSGRGTSPRLGLGAVLARRHGRSSRDGVCPLGQGPHGPMWTCAAQRVGNLG